MTPKEANKKMVANPSPEGRGCREAAGEGCRESSLYPSPGPSGHLLPSGERFVRNISLSTEQA